MIRFRVLTNDDHVDTFNYVINLQLLIFIKENKIIILRLYKQ